MLFCHVIKYSSKNTSMPEQYCIICSCDFHNHLSIVGNLESFFSCLWTMMQWKILNKTLPAFLVYPFKEIPESGNYWLKNMNIFITSLCTLSNCYLESLKQFLGLPPLQNDSLQIITRIYFNLSKIFANV